MAIIPEEIHVLLVAHLTDPARTRADKPRGNKPQNLLSGLALCAECGKPTKICSYVGLYAGVAIFALLLVALKVGAIEQFTK